MKISKEEILKIELTGDDLENFKSALSKVVMAERGSYLEIGMLKETERKLIELILKEVSK